MAYRGNDFDVSSQFNTTDPKVVNDEIDRIIAVRLKRE